MTFELVKEQTIPELNTHAQFYRHREIGAELLSLINDDENKVFGVSFRTPPSRSDGIAHIMEHSVLCGSRKYPVKEPFIELAKGSLNTFLNAFTSPDKTTYPVASQNLQDFYNLVDVYLDSVFYPNITPETLEQEGWHLELDDPEAPIIYKGVVFNEMKGAYSSPEAVMYRLSQQATFPDNCYGVDSGGDPKVIPSLTFDEFMQFHQVHYHPSNARLYFYGDDDPAQRLEILEAYLSDFESQSAQTEVSLQPTFSEPRRVVGPYTASPEAAQEDKTLLTLNWLLPENNDSTLTLGLSVLSYSLISTSASLLHKVLIDSGLGEDVLGGGLSAHLRQMDFSVGMKGIKRENLDAVEALILDTLRQIVTDGIPTDQLEAALNTIEFRMREFNTGGYPRGLAIYMDALSTWNHGQDPIEQIQFDAPLAEVKQNWADNPRYFEALIETHLLNNTHRVTVILEPDAELQQKTEAEEAAKLAEIKASLSADELAQIIAQTQRLRELQETPDAPEDLAKVPSLKLSDIDPQNKLIPCEVIAEADGSTTLYHDLFTNGIVYFDFAFNMHGLPAELLPYVSLFTAALRQIGTENEDFVQLSRRIGRKTGGIYASSMVTTQPNTPEAAAWLIVRGKATVDQIDDLLDIIRDMLLKVNLDNQERFLQMILEDKAGSEASLVPAGHRTALTRIKANFTEAGWAQEQMGGVSNLLFLRELLDQAQNDWPSVLAKFEQIKQLVFNRNAMISNVTVDAESWQEIQPKLNRFVAEFPAFNYQAQAWPWQAGVPHQAITATAAQVNYVIKAANLYEAGYQFDGSVAVIQNYLRTGYLWERVRMQGGAYGAFCSFDRDSGLFNFGSYRDPNLRETLAVYDQAGDFLRQVELNEDQLTKSIIGVIGDFDTYRLPDAKGYASMSRYLLGYTDEMRQAYRDQVLSTTAQDFHDFADKLAYLGENGQVAIVGSPDAVAAANDDGWLSVEQVL